MKHYATWERNFANQYNLVIYHDYKPEMDKNIRQREHTPYFDVPEEFIDIDGNVDMALVEKAYPKPIEPIEEKIKIGSEISTETSIPSKPERPEAL